MGLMHNLPANDAGWKCDECGKETVWDIETLGSPYVPRDHKGHLLTDHEDNCPVGLRQNKILSWHHIGIGFGL